MELWQSFVHDLDPVALRFGLFGKDIAVHWYGIMWVAGFATGFQILLREARLGRLRMGREAVSDFVFWAMLGTIVGGRLGFVVFYDLFADHPRFPSRPLDIFKIWEGGLSFHGGVIGLVLVIARTAKRHAISMFHLGDAVVLGATPGILFVRIGNFINGELYGRAAEGVPWAVRFPTGGDQPRHPSQLYEGLLEGLLLFLVLLALRRRGFARVDGRLSALFLAGYGVARFIVEFFREPDKQFRGEGEAHGFVLLFFSMGQLLCFAMILGGLLVWRLAEAHHARRSRVA